MQTETAMNTSVTAVDRSQPLPPKVDAIESVYSKVSRRIIPLLLIAYMVAFLDRINIGYAQLQMKQTLAFGDAVYGLGAGIFFLGYFLFEVPSNLLLEKIGRAKRCCGSWCCGGLPQRRWRSFQRRLSSILPASCSAYSRPDFSPA